MSLLTQSFTRSKTHQGPSLPAPVTLTSTRTSGSAHPPPPSGRIAQRKIGIAALEGPIDIDVGMIDLIKPCTCPIMQIQRASGSAYVMAAYEQLRSFAPDTDWRRHWRVSFQSTMMRSSSQNMQLFCVSIHEDRIDSII